MPPSGRLPTHSAPGLSEKDLMERIRQADTARELGTLFHRTTDAQFKAEIACRALQLDPRAGRVLAEQFLSEEPPLFFRRQVIGAMEAADKGPK